MSKAPLGVALDIEWSDYLARTAMENGWGVQRQTTRYFIATKDRAQIGVSVSWGHLTASRIEVLEETNVSDTVVRWMEGTL